MAKARIRTAGGGSTHILGPTLFTEKIRQASYDGDVATVYYEAWRVRSDGDVQTRIIKTWPHSGSGHETRHSSGFRSIGKIKPPESAQQTLRHWLERRGYDIVKEAY